MSQFLLVTRTHGLLPLANRLRNSGVEAEIIVWKPRYQSAWDGRFRTLVRSKDGPPSAEALKTVQAALDTGEITLLSDLTNCPLGAPRSYLRGPQEAQLPLRLGAWVTLDGALVAPHLLVYDFGVWPNGLGRQQPAAAVTLVRLEGRGLEFATEVLSEGLLERHAGLVEVDIQADDDGELALGKMNWGWPWLQTHAFLSSLENFPAVLDGSEPEWEHPNQRYTVALPVSVPPWPEHGRAAAELELGQLTPQLHSRFFWHDVRLDPEARTMTTAGLDGLVGVAHGSGAQAGVAAQRALQAAVALELHEKQFRPDIAGYVRPVLEALELNFGVTIE